MIREVLLALIIFVIILFLVDVKNDEEVVMVVMTPTYSGSDYDNVVQGQAPYHSYDNCMGSCGRCNTYNTEPVLREMVYFNNLYDMEHSFEQDPPDTFAPFAGVYAEGR